VPQLSSVPLRLAFPTGVAQALFKLHRVMASGQKEICDYGVLEPMADDPKCLVESDAKLKDDQVIDQAAIIRGFIYYGCLGLLRMDAIAERKEPDFSPAFAIAS
jgi:hypothetical protein